MSQKSLSISKNKSQILKLFFFKHFKENNIRHLLCVQSVKKYKDI